MKALTSLGLLASLSLSLASACKPTCGSPSAQEAPVVAPGEVVADQPLPEAAVEDEENPLPWFEDVPKNSEAPIFPVQESLGKVMVSIHGEGSMVSEKLEQKLKKVYEQQKSPPNFMVEGDLMREVLAELKIDENHSVFWFLFGQTTEASLKIKDVKGLLVIYNDNGGDGILGALGIELPVQYQAPKDDNSFSNGAMPALGLASIGPASLLNPSEAKEIQWAGISDGAFPQGKAFKQANKLEPVADEQERTLKQDLTLTSSKLGGVELIQANAQFERKDTGVPGANVNEENLYAYFLRDQAGLKTLYSYYMEGSYGQRPLKFLAGNWVKGFDSSIYVSSAGMMDCGRLVLLKAGAVPVAMPIRCGIWGAF